MGLEDRDQLESWWSAVENITIVCHSAYDPDGFQGFEGQVKKN